MPKPCRNPGIGLETLASHSDPSVPLVTVFSRSRFTPDFDDPDDTDAIKIGPRPRPSLQIYYTAPLSTPNELETVARTLETVVLEDRFQTSGADHERLDVYSLPPAMTTTASEEEREAVKDGLFATLAEADSVVQRCVAHQQAEIAARENHGKDWYIQRYDVPQGDWRRAIIIISTPVAEWEWDRDERTRRCGMVLSTVMFDHTKDGPDEVWVSSGSTSGEIWVLVHELRHELNWQHSFVQFLD